MIGRVLCRCGALVVAFVGLACSPQRSLDPKFIEDIRPVSPSLKVNSFTIQRRDLQHAVSIMGDTPIRLVPVYQTVSSIESYEYRVFDVNSDSVYALLGLENSDIIVAVDRYLIKNPAQFPAFVHLLGNENEASIEIRRAGEARLMKYSFIPALQRR